MKTRITALIVAAIMLMAVLSFPASAVSENDIKHVSNAPAQLYLTAPATVNAGSTFTISLKLRNFSEAVKTNGLNSVSCELVYDHSLITVDEDSLAVAKAPIQNKKDAWDDLQISSSNTFCMLFIVNLYDEYSLKNPNDFELTLSFKVSENAAGKTIVIYPKDASSMLIDSEEDIDVDYVKIAVASKPAEITTIDGIGYILNSSAKTASVANVADKAKTDLKLARKVTYSGVEYAVSSIEASAFADLASLKTATIPCSVTSIGSGVFASASSVTVKGCEASAAESYAKSVGAKFELDTSEYTSTVVTEATCKTTGSQKLTCNYCNSSLTRELPLKDHTFGEWTVTKPATYTEAGEKKHTCTVCGETETAVVPILVDCKHTDTEEIVTKKATCTEKGVADIKCKICGEIIGTKELPLLEHTFGEWKTVKEATYTAKGLEERTCSVCNAKETRDIPLLACTHPETRTSHKDATCTTDGYDRVICRQCGQIISTTVIKAAHTPGSIETKDATCTEDGYRIQKCTECGEFIINETIPAAGHQYGEWETVVAATATSEGTRKRTCSVCGQVEVEVIPKLSAETSDEISEPAIETSDSESQPSEVSSAASGTESKEETGGMSNRTIFLIIGGVVILLTAGYIVITIINKKKNY